MPQSTTRSNSARTSSAKAARDFTCCAIALPTVSQPSRSRISGVSGSSFHTVGIAGPDALGQPGRHPWRRAGCATAASTTGNTAEWPGGAWAASAWRLVRITPSSASNDLANFSMPSSSSTRVTSARSTPPAASRSRSRWASLASSVQRAPHGPVILEEPERRGRHRIDGVGADERVHVEHVGVARVLGAGAGPQEPLGPGAGRRPAACHASGSSGGRGTRRRPAARWRSRPCRGGRAAAPPLASMRRSVSVSTRLTKNEATEASRSIGWPARCRASSARTCASATSTVVLEREQQGDVDVDPLGEEPLDRPASLPWCRAP